MSRTPMKLILTQGTLENSSHPRTDIFGNPVFDRKTGMPLTVKEIQAVAFFKEAGPDDWRVSMRSKGEVDVNAIAREFGGGGHKNASGCSATGTLPALKASYVDPGATTSVFPYDPI